MKKVRPRVIGILVGFFVGLVYGFSVLASVMRDMNSGIALGGLMGVGMAGIIVMTLQSQERLRH